MKKTLSRKLVRQARVPSASANTSDLITTICDMGSCQNATAIISLDYTDALDHIDFWTSSSDSCIASGTAQTATTNTVQVVLASDDDSLQASSGSATAVTGLAVSSNVITSLAADGDYAVELPNIRRYLAMQFNGNGSSSNVGVTFIGRDMLEAPNAAARSAY